MSTWVALLRGINVGGKHKLPMAALRADLGELGLQDVRTYIQSGNVVFVSEARSAPKLAASIEEALEASHGFRPAVLLLTADQLRAAVEANPFPEATAEPKTLHLSFLAAPAEAPDLDVLAELASPTERFELRDRVFYLHAPDGIGRSKLAARVERALGVLATSRNWRTVQQLQALVAES